MTGQLELRRRPDGCIVEVDRAPARVACCCEKVWSEGDRFDIYGGRACFLCVQGFCPRTHIIRILAEPAP